MSWDIHFPNPIMTPQGTALVTLGDAARYITAMPKREPMNLLGKTLCTS